MTNTLYRRHHRKIDFIHEELAEAVGLSIMFYLACADAKHDLTVEQIRSLCKKLNYKEEWFAYCARAGELHYEHRPELHQDSTAANRFRPKLSAGADESLYKCFDHHMLKVEELRLHHRHELRSGMLFYFACADAKNELPSDQLKLLIEHLGFVERSFGYCAAIGELHYQFAETIETISPWMYTMPDVD